METWSNLQIIIHQSCRLLFSWTNALTLIILKNVSLIEVVNWCRHSKFSQTLLSASYIPATWANDATNWCLKNAYLWYKVQLDTVSISWDTKGGCSLFRTHTILVERRAIVWLAHYCVHIFLILCVAQVYDDLFSQLSYSPEIYLWRCAQKLKVASKINEKFSGKYQGHRMSLTWDIKKWFQNTNPLTIYPFNVNNKSTRRRCEVYWELIKLTFY